MFAGLGQSAAWSHQTLSLSSRTGQLLAFVQLNNPASMVRAVGNHQAAPQPAADSLKLAAKGAVQTYTIERHRSTSRTSHHWAQTHTGPQLSP